MCIRDRVYHDLSFCTWARQTRECTYLVYRRWCRSLSLMLSCLTVSFSCVVYSLTHAETERPRESEKKQTSVYLIKRKMKEKILYTYQVRTYISPSAVALAAGVNSNPSSREKNLYIKSNQSSIGRKALRHQKKTIQAICDSSCAVHHGVRVGACILS